ncbi:hypothetical protein BUALT_Bualt15G0133700 [Buddleja alternifolia]|uniref:Uncharacterized protein n=1 Tax=Buddleja alternifolia TaxID=168488 RepID=A0AAV6WLG9_9LAMI|nr:hypothetical protein BUALT_Bualt15G0133700 [Buddleja alternifolia]
MARHILLRHHPITISHIGFGVGSLILCAFALFMCASHSQRKWRRWKACYGHGNQEPIIQLNREEIFGYQFGDVDQSSYSGDQGPVWKKNILMGGKCELPNFSGVIIYDSTGNVVTPAQNRQSLPALPWK